MQKKNVFVEHPIHPLCTALPTSCMGLKYVWGQCKKKSLRNQSCSRLCLSFKCKIKLSVQHEFWRRILYWRVHQSWCPHQQTSWEENDTTLNGRQSCDLRWPSWWTRWNLPWTYWRKSLDKTCLLLDCITRCIEKRSNIKWKFFQNLELLFYLFTLRGQ